MKNTIYALSLSLLILSCSEIKEDNTTPKILVNNIETETISDTIKTLQDTINYPVSFYIESDQSSKFSFQFFLKSNNQGIIPYLNNKIINFNQYIDVANKNDLKFIHTSKIADNQFDIFNLNITIQDKSNNNLNLAINLYFFKNLSPDISALKYESYTDPSTNYKYYKINFANCFDKDDKYGGYIKQYIFIINNKTISFTKEEAQNINYLIENIFENKDKALNCEFFAIDNENSVSKTNFTIQ